MRWLRGNQQLGSLHPICQLQDLTIATNSIFMSLLVLTSHTPRGYRPLVAFLIGLDHVGGATVRLHLSDSSLDAYRGGVALSI